MDKYIPHSHWEEKSGLYLKDFNIRRDLIYKPVVRYIVRREIRRATPKRLLEVGCGPGRLFSCYRDVKNVTCVDFAPGMIERAQAVNRFGYDLYVMDGGNLGFGDTCFDMVVTSNVLLHVPPDSIGDVVGEICRVGRSVVCVELDRPCTSSFCFYHDYQLLFYENDFVLVRKVRVAGESDQSLFVFERG